MDLLVPDYSETQRDLSAGKYELELLNWESKTASTGTKIIAWQFVVASPEEYVGQKVFHNTPMHGSGASMLRKLVKAFSPAYIEGPFNANSFIGKRIMARLCKGRMPDGSPSAFLRVTTVFSLPNAESEN